MKALAHFLLLAMPFYALAQQSAFTNQTHTILQKVINDYPNHFRNIKGPVIIENPQTTDYTSTVQIPGSVNTVITRYSGSEDNEIYSWKCVMMESEDFETVSKMQKKSMYYDVNNTKICRNHYKSSTGIFSLIKNIWAVLLIGESPINQPSNRRKIH